MKHIFKILSFLALLFLIMAEKCEDNSGVQMSGKTKSEGMFQDLENGFLTEELAPEDLLAFEKRALQKLSDLSDYLSLYGNPDISPEFRSQAGNMIRKTFYSEEDLQKYFQELSYFEDTTENQLYNGLEYDVVKTNIDSIRIDESLRKKGNLTYEGTIQYSQVLYPVEASGKSPIHFHERKMKIILVKSEKYFGEKSLQVWTVYLGK